MERKIDEIFEYNGEWYQCLESNSCRCDYCEFGELAHCHEIACASGERSDNVEVYFKKLEKAGEPYNIGTHIYQRYKVFMKPYIFNDSYFAVNPAIDDEFINIEIKQTKEDMGDNDIRPYDEMFSPGTVSNTKHLAKEDMEEFKIYDAREDIPEFDNIVDECLFGEDKSNLKPFDIQKAREGKPVCTRDGRKARIICFDAKAYKNKEIIALITKLDGYEYVEYFSQDGRFSCLEEGRNDLMMLPEKKEGWVNVYDADTTFYFVEGMVYDTKEEAIKHINPDHEIYITTVKIEWEE